MVKALCVACGSNVGDGTENRFGSWLMLTCFQTSVISSAMFLTAMAANPLSANLTYGAIKQTIGWTDWAVAAIVPGLVSLVVVPLLLYLICPPTVKNSPDALKLAREKLAKMGPMTKNETIMAGTLLLTVLNSSFIVVLPIFLLAYRMNLVDLIISCASYPRLHLENFLNNNVLIVILLIHFAYNATMPQFYLKMLCLIFIDLDF